MFGLLGYLTSPIGLISLGLLIGCVVHMIRTGNVFPWIYVVVFLPSVGPLIYFFMVIVPGLMRSRGVHRIGSGVARAVDPNKDYREAVRAADVVGSIGAKRALAEHYVQRGRTDEAIELYQSMLQGQFKDDPVLLLGLARAQLPEGRRRRRAGDRWTQLQAADPKFVSEEAHMIYARSLELQGKNEDAAAEYEKLARYASGEEARARYAMSLDRLGRRDEARAIYAQIAKNLDGATRRYRSDQAEWGNIAKAALKS